jgi:phosphatidylethanolamine/phosphatidyl-N-methylethanolamine N-methyltransferase
MKRVCKPGGDIFIVNHFSHSHPFVRRCEELLAPFSRFIGFRPNLSMEDFLESTALNVETITPINLFGYWRIIHTKKEAVALLTSESAQDRETKSFDEQSLVTTIIR